MIIAFLPIINDIFVLEAFITRAQQLAFDRKTSIVFLMNSHDRMLNLSASTVKQGHTKTSVDFELIGIKTESSYSYVAEFNKMTDFKCLEQFIGQKKVVIMSTSGIYGRLDKLDEIRKSIKCAETIISNKAIQKSVKDKQQKTIAA